MVRFKGQSNELQINKDTKPKVTIKRVSNINVFTPHPPGLFIRRSQLTTAPIATNETYTRLSLSNKNSFGFSIRASGNLPSPALPFD